MSLVSTRNLDALPGIDRLKSILQALALLDAIMCPMRLLRLHFFNSNWASDEQVAEMHNGFGDSYCVLFNQYGCFIKGFNHESRMSTHGTHISEIWPGIVDDLPEQFSSIMTKSSDSVFNITFGIWRTYSGQSWLRGKIDFPDGPDPDGSEDLLYLIDGDPAKCQEYVEACHGATVSIDSVRQLYDHVPLTDDLVKSFNPDMTVEKLSGEIKEIRY